MTDKRGYRPMMPSERADRLREWHERALERGKRDETITVTYLGWTFVVPPDVYEPNPHGLAEIVGKEATHTDRVLDLGTGSGVNAIAAASRSADVVAVDINPSAVAAARENADRNGVGSRVHVAESNLFDKVSGRFDLIVFDPPYRWFRPRSMRERATADENYETLTAFFRDVRRYLTPRGRVLLSFGTTGDIAYLRHLVSEADFVVEVLREVRKRVDGRRVAYFAYRLTP